MVPEKFKQRKKAAPPRPKLERKCIQCGAAFMAAQSRIEAGRAIYCSMRCRGLFEFNQRFKKNQKNNGFWGPHKNPRFRQIAIECLTCRSVFRTYSKENPRKYCSAKCYHAQKGTKKGKYSKVYRYGRMVYEHRWIMQEHIGRMLKTEEEVHHKNGDRSDNRIENLEIVVSGKHQKEHNNKGAAKIIGPADRSMPFRP